MIQERTRANILYLSERSGMGGGEESLLNLMPRLDRKEFMPVLALPGTGPFAAKAKEAGVDTEFIAFPRIRSMVGVLSAVNRLNELIRRKDIHLIHSNSIRTHIYAAITGRLNRIPVVWHERSLITTEIIDPDRALSFLPDKIICNSRAIAERFRIGRGIPSKVVTIINGVDLDRFSPKVDGSAARQKFNIREGEVVIGIAARFHPIKGHDTFLKAARMVIEKCAAFRQGVRFLVAGGTVFAEDAEHEIRVRKLAEDLGIADKVIFTGIIDDMSPIYAAMDMLVLASRAEGCGRVIFEAMATGRPVIGTNSGGTPEIIVDGVTGILVPPEDTEAMAGAMAELALNEKKRLSMGAEGRKRCEDLFDIKLHVKKTERIYEELLRRAR